jgi:hypothetical protein
MNWTIADEQARDGIFHARILLDGKLTGYVTGNSAEMANLRDVLAGDAKLWAQVKEKAARTEEELVAAHKEIARLRHDAAKVANGERPSGDATTPDVDLAIRARHADIATIADAGPRLSTNDVERCAERIFRMVYLYGGSTVKRRGPIGCLTDVLAVIRPDLLEQIKDWEDWDRIYAERWGDDEFPMRPEEDTPPKGAETAGGCPRIPEVPKLLRDAAEASRSADHGGLADALAEYVVDLADALRGGAAS